MNTSTFSAAGDRIALIETFVRIVEAGSLSAAAQQLGGTQPTISRRLQALERAFGVRLLQRSTHAMQLTDDGRRCYERAKELIGAWQAFESEVSGAGQELVGSLRVIVPHAFGQEQFVGPLANYLHRYPGMNVEWLLDDRMPDFAAEAVDCAVRVGHMHDESVVAVKLGEVPRIIVAAPALLETAPEHPDQLARLPWLALRTFYRDELTLRHWPSGTSVRLDIAPRMATDSLYALRSAALLGVGVAVGSKWVFAEDLAAGTLRQLVPDWQAEPLPVYLVYPPVRFQPRRLRRFIETMRAALAPQFYGSANADSDGVQSRESDRASGATDR